MSGCLVANITALTAVTVKVDASVFEISKLVADDLIVSGAINSNLFPFVSGCCNCVVNDTVKRRFGIKINRCADGISGDT